MQAWRPAQTRTPRRISRRQATKLQDEQEEAASPITKGGPGHVRVPPTPPKSVLSSEGEDSSDNIGSDNFGYSDTDEESVTSAAGGRSRIASPTSAKRNAASQGAKDATRREGDY